MNLKSTIRKVVSAGAILAMSGGVLAACGGASPRSSSPPPTSATTTNGGSTSTTTSTSTGSSSTSSSTAGGGSTSSQAWTIAVSNGYAGNAARQEYEAELKAYAALPSVKPHIKKLIINNAGQSVAAQISAVDNMIAEHVNAIILDSNSLTGLNSTIAAAHKAGILVVAANDRVSSPLVYQVQTVGKQFGADMMNGLVQLLHGHGNIVVLRGIAGNAVDAAEASGFKAVLAKNPGIRVLDTVYPQWDDAQAQSDMSNLLSRYHNIDGVFTEGGMEQGVVRAYLAAHRPFVPVTGTDENGFSCQVKKYQKDGLSGVQVGTGIYAYALALKATLALLSGQKEPHVIPLHWTTWNTQEAIGHCQPNLSPSLFLQTKDPAAGINLTPLQVQKYMH